MLNGKLHLLKRILLIQSFYTLLWKLQLNLVSCFPKYCYRKVTHLLSLENISANFSIWLITRLANLPSLLSSTFTSSCGSESCSKYYTPENRREREILQTEHRLVTSHQGFSHFTKVDVNRAGFAAGIPHLATSTTVVPSTTSDLNICTSQVHPAALVAEPHRIAQSPICWMPLC